MAPSLWVDRYRPTTLDHLDFHDSLTEQLRSMAASSDFPHMLVYGPSGAGKKTRIVAALREIYGPGVEKLKIDLRTFVTASNRKMDINVVMSNYHIELTPSDIGNYDRIIIQDLIKELAQTQQVDASAKRSFKVVVLNEADYLSRDAQAALRRTMEKYMGNLRIIMCANSTSKIIPPIRSRCLLMRVPAPTTAEICEVLGKVAVSEGINLPDALSRRIAEASDGNLRKAILMLEAAKVHQYPFSDNQPVLRSDWELFIEEMAKHIIQEQTPKRLQEIRGKFYELLTHCISADVILKTLTFELTKNVDPAIAREIVIMAADYHLQKGKFDFVLMVKAKEGTSSAATTPGPGNAPRSAIVPSGSKKDSKKSTAKVTITEPIAASAASLATTVANADKPTLNRVSLSPTSNLGSSTHTLSASESTAYLEIDPTLKDRTGLREEELRELIEIFSLVDVDHGGTISTDELETLMKTVGLKASQDELEIIVKELDTEGTGEIDFESFVVGMSRKVQTNLTVEDLSRAFRIFERFEVPHDQTVKKPKDPVETKTTEDGETDHDHLGGIIPTALVAKILTDYGDIDKRMLPREAEDIIASVGPPGSTTAFNYDQFIEMYIGTT